MPFRAEIQVRDVEFNALNRNFIAALKLFIVMFNENKCFTNNLIAEWFSQNNNRVLSQIRNILIYFQNDTIKVRCAEHGELMGKTSVAAKGKDGKSVAVGAVWFNLPVYVDYQNSSNDRGKIKTLFHELSHIVLKTEDESVTIQAPWIGGPKPTMPQSVSAYGIAHCKELARNNAAKAITNADNWGYFLEYIYRCYLANDAPKISSGRLPKALPTGITEKGAHTV